MVSAVWSVFFCLLFFYSRCPCAQPFVKVEGTSPGPYIVSTTRQVHAIRTSAIYCQLTHGFRYYVAVPVSVPVSVSVAVSVAVSVTFSVKPCPYMPFRMPLMGRVCGSNAAGPGGRPPSFPRKRVGGVPGVCMVRTERQVRKNRTRSYQWQRRTYGNGERKLRSYYGILTDERNSYVLCYGNGHGNRYVTPRRWKSAVRLHFADFGNPVNGRVSAVCL